MEAGPEVLELHLLQLALLQQPGVPGVVVKHLPVPVFFRGPEVVPASPEALVSQVDGQEPVEVREALLGEEVQGQGGAGMVGDSGGLAPELGQVGVGAFVRARAHQVRREPELALALVRLHQLPDLLLQVLEHLDFRVRSRVRSRWRCP